VSLSGPPEFKLHTRDNTRFREADRYSSYLKTPTGKLRTDLAWENLCRFLPNPVSEKRALDLGGGTGLTGIRLAQMEFQVVLLDTSEEMIGIAKRGAEDGGVGKQMSFCCADASKLRKLFKPESFDLVLCHNLLEYVADPAAIVLQIASVLRKDGLVSVLVRNRAGEVLKAAINSVDWELAKANLAAEMVVESLYGKPVRVFDPKDVAAMLVSAGLEVISEYGVRVFSDYIHLRDKKTHTDYPQLLELELVLGAQSNFANIARYTQMIARRCDVNATEKRHHDRNR
jgi:2-polyprenyl-3-methyl-5-hydroxy-6-metoxy-1,4-benzoquinol methylase